MNILPIVLALVLMLSVMTIERLEKFKNQTVVQSEYKKVMNDSDGKEFNIRENSLYLLPRNIHRQLSFRYILSKELRDKDENKAKEYRQVAIDLIKVLYRDADFYKKMESENSKFVEELIDQIEEAADNAPKDSIKRIEDISKLQLKDPEMQEAFYHMLKGTIQRDKLKTAQTIAKKEGRGFSPREKGKTYVSLLTYIHNRKEGPVVQLAPKELLQALFENDQVVDEILIRRNELAKEKDSNSKEAFTNEFNPKRKPGLSDLFLNFEISKSNKTKYD